MQLIIQDLRYAVRSLVKQPLFSLTVVLVLALGIAGTTGIFSIFNGLFLRPLPFEEPDRIVNLDVTAPQWNLEFVGINYNDFEAWRDRNQSFEAMAVIDAESVNMSLDGEALRAEAAMITHDVFDVLRIEPVAGRRFTAAEDQPGAAGVVLLGNALWKDTFASSTDVLGRPLLINGEPHTVIGVLPAEAIFIDSDLWIPLRPDPAENRGSFWLSGLGRLREGVDIDRARADLEQIHKAMIEERPVNEATSPVVIPVLDRFLGEFRLGTMALLAGVSVVLLIACANVAGLMLARATTRTREVGIRVALGAGRRRILQQLLTESLLLAGTGAVLGVALGVAGVRAALAAAPEDIPRWISFEMDALFLAFVIAVTVGAALGFGFVPALRAARTDPQRVLQAAGRTTVGRAGRRGLSALVVGEIALALTLLVGAGLFMSAVREVQRVDPGFVAENVLSYSVSLPEAVYADDESQRSFFDEHLDAVGALPGVVDVGAASAVPLGGHTGYFFEAEGAAPRGDDEPNPVTLTRWATQGYFRALGINLLQGRTFTAADEANDAPTVAVVNQSFAAYHWPDQDPLGKRFSTGSQAGWITVIGVTQDVKHYGLAEDMRPGVYLFFDPSPRATMTVVARTEVDPLGLVGSVRDLVRERDPDLPIFEIASMRQRLDESLWARRAASWTFAIFAGIAVVLATSGIYSVVSFSVGQRTREIGIRMALGARRAQVVSQVLRQGGALVAIGVALGLGAAIAVSRLLTALLFGVSATDPVVYASVTVLLVSIAALANAIPARRASTIDPMAALRND